MTQLENIDQGNCNFQEAYLKQYELYLNAIEKNSDRRQSTNTLYSGISTLILTGIGIIHSQKIGNGLQYGIVLIGLTIAVLRYININSYKQLNSIKFELLHEIEKKLPLNLHSYERKKLGYGNKLSVYFPYSHVELWIPRILVVIYIAWSIYISRPGC